MLTNKFKIHHRKKIFIVAMVCIAVFTGLFIRLVYLMTWRADYYAQMATDLHEREEHQGDQRAHS